MIRMQSLKKVWPLQKAPFLFVAFNHLLPFPGTKLHDRFVEENKLHQEEWWLKDGYRYGDIPYNPVDRGPVELSEKCAHIRHRFFTIGSIFRRSFVALKRHKSFMVFGIFLSQNLNLKREIDEKLKLPIGVGLDELPK